MPTRMAKVVTTGGQIHLLKSGYASARKIPGNALLVLKLPASNKSLSTAFDAQSLLESAPK